MYGVRSYLLGSSQLQPEKVLFQTLLAQELVLEQRRRAREAKAEGSYTAEEWKMLCKALGDRCFDCGRADVLTVGHAIPLSKGGSNWIDNLIPQCPSCNSRQKDKVHSLWLNT